MRPMTRGHGEHACGERGEGPGRRVLSSTLRLAALAALALGVSGCYTYQPLQGAPEPGDRIRARLTVEAAVRRSRMLGEQVDAVSGRVETVGPDGGLGLVIPLDRTREQIARRQEITQRLTLAMQDVESLEIRRLSAWRTGVLGVGVAALASVAVQRTITGGSEGNGGGGNGTTLSLIVDLIPLLGGR